MPYVAESSKTVHITINKVKYPVLFYSTISIISEKTQQLHTATVPPSFNIVLPVSVVWCFSCTASVTKTMMMVMMMMMMMIFPLLPLRLVIFPLMLPQYNHDDDDDNDEEEEEEEEEGEEEEEEDG